MIQQWVKASERLPEGKGTYKIIGKNNQGDITPEHTVWFTGERWTIREGCEVLQWLDESPTKETVDNKDAEGEGEI